MDTIKGRMLESEELKGFKIKAKERSNLFTTALRNYEM